MSPSLIPDEGLLRPSGSIDTIGRDVSSEPRNERPFDSHNQAARPGGFFVSAIRRSVRRLDAMVVNFVPGVQFSVHT